MQGTYGPPEAYRPPRDPRRRFALALFAVVVVLISSTVGVLVAIDHVASQLPPSSGVVGSAVKQNVNGDGGAWLDLCEIPSNESSCVQVSGLVDVDGSGLAVVTFTNGNLTSARFGIGVLNLTLGTWEAHLSTNCSPYEPYYPGQGQIVYIGCWTEQATSVVEFDFQNASIVGAFPVPSGVLAWGYDPTVGWLYLGLSGGEILAVNPTTGAPEAERSFGTPGSEDSGTGSWSYLSWNLLYDPFTDLVLSQADASELVALNPQNLSLQKVVPTGTTPWAMAVDPANGQLYVSTDAGALLAYNATTFAPVANVSISSSTCGNAGAPFTTDQMILDPSHGDLYLQGFSYCLGVVNITGDYAMPTISWGGDGYGFAVYDPATHVVWSYYPGDVVLGPVYARSLSFSTYPVLVSVLFLPAPIGETLIVGAIWVVGAYGSYLLYRRFERTRGATVDRPVGGPSGPRNI